MRAPAANYRAGGREGRPAGKDRWRTPPDLYARLDAEFGFALDAACDSDNRLAPRGYEHDRGWDALRMSWWTTTQGAGAVWVNPPYSNLRPWLEKGRQEGGLGPAVVMLVPADTSTRWWLDLVASDATEVRFLTGRPKFHLPEGGEHKTKRSGGGLTTPSALVIYTPAGGPPTYSYTPAVTAEERAARRARRAA